MLPQIVLTIVLGFMCVVEILNVDNEKSPKLYMFVLGIFYGGLFGCLYGGGFYVQEYNYLACKLIGTMIFTFFIIANFMTLEDVSKKHNIRLGKLVLLKLMLYGTLLTCLIMGGFFTL